MEYVLIVSLLALACYAGYERLGKGYNNIYTGISAELQNVNDGTRRTDSNP